MAGEVQAAKAIIARCRHRLAQDLLFSEIIGQAAVAVVQGRFAEQKFVSFPRSVQQGLLNEV